MRTWGRKRSPNHPNGSPVAHETLSAPAVPASYRNILSCSGCSSHHRLSFEVEPFSNDFPKMHANLPFITSKRHSEFQTPKPEHLQDQDYTAATFYLPETACSSFKRRFTALSSYQDWPWELLVRELG